MLYTNGNSTDILFVYKVNPHGYKTRLTLGLEWSSV